MASTSQRPAQYPHLPEHLWEHVFSFLRINEWAAASGACRAFSLHTWAVLPVLSCTCQVVHVIVQYSRHVHHSLATYFETVFRHACRVKKPLPFQFGCGTH